MPGQLRLKRRMNALVEQVVTRNGALHWLLLLHLLYLLLGIKRSVNIYDEGLVLYGASRILAGDIPYQDFWTVYGPAQFYLLAALFKIFGPSLLIARLADTLTRLALSLSAYLIARRLLPAKIAVLPWIAVTLLLGPTGPEVSAVAFYGYPVFPALALGMGSTLLLTSYVSQPTTRALVISGILAGLASTFRQDIGLYFIVCSSIVLVAYTLASSSACCGRRLAYRFFHTPGLFLGAACLSALLVYSPFILSAGPQTLWHDLVVFPATVLRTERELTYPPLLPLNNLRPSMMDMLVYFSYRWGRFYLPLLVYVLTAGYILFTTRRTGINHTHWRLLLLMLSGAALFMQGLHRSDEVHLLPTNIPAVILITYLFWAALNGSLRRSYTLLMTLLLPLLAATYLLLPARVWWRTVQHSSFLWPPRCLVRQGCPGISPDQLQAIHLIQQHTASTERIYVGLGLHDRIHINDIAFYFFAERHSATRYHELHPGLANTHSVQEEIIQELQTHNVRYIVLFGRPPLDRETTPGASGVLDEFIRNDYRKVRDSGKYTLWLSKEEPVPPGLIHTEKRRERKLK